MEKQKELKAWSLELFQIKYQREKEKVSSTEQGN